MSAKQLRYQHFAQMCVLVFLVGATRYGARQVTTSYFQRHGPCHEPFRHSDQKCAYIETRHQKHFVSDANHWSAHRFDQFIRNVRIYEAARLSI
jgi:hypothetical protein